MHRGHEIVQDLAEAHAQLVVDQAAVRVESGDCLRDRKLDGKDAGTDQSDDLLELGLSPDGSERPGEAPITATGSLLSGFVATGRETQSIAFFSWPGIEALYSGVAKSTASASAIADRNLATVNGGGWWSSSSS